MKTILVPTDFSIHAERALNFAIQLAKKQKTKLILFHAYQVPVAVAAVSFNMLALEKEETEANAEKKMKLLCRKLEMEKHLNYEYLVEEGDVVDSILSAVDKKEVDLIIMGTKGETGLGSLVFGSNASGVIARSSCPVMAIPEKASWNGIIKKITFASNYTERDLPSIAKLVDIASPLNAQLNILHISNDEFTSEQEIKMMADFRKKVENEVNYNQFSFQVIHGKHVEKQLEKYVAQGGTDMLVLSAHDHTFLERIFVKNIAKDFVNEAAIPLIIFHVKN